MQKSRPSVIALSRQGTPTVSPGGNQNRSSKGAYVISEAEGELKAILIATGTEVPLALNAREILQSKGIGTRVVSMPCTELFDEQPNAYREKILPKGILKAAIEAGSIYGWERYVDGGPIVGMTTFGASAPADDLYNHFGITADALVENVEVRLNTKA